MNLLKKLRLGISLIALLGLTGCAKTCDQIDAQGGLVTSHKAPYIIVNQSGGEIMDVYKLQNAIVQSEATSDGWLFKGPKGHPIFVGGDIKTIRLPSTNDPLWDQYHEYHMEFESKSYRELYNPR